ncbi:HNH endonuclease [Citrobacter freundii]|uniref:HNH endonuclease n=1 Tax=Citrobacter freundii TaxID=546 RepID=UPI0015EAB036|nr:HNH endonuclease [Citrobacter freundii]QLU14979.1 HNH endonuclease [Citrobacter freundii]QLU15551.1 HNH endonuclease [Citrobacter freundii]HCL6635739.1 HNH endonuclease [Citrobacter freundii]HCL6761473.1 HNH endonuclease [Citrobacter freundii]HED2425520.1 HNH endonuclease [Citrobacter freundii]
MERQEGIIKRFVSMYSVNESTGCWESTYAKNKGGYTKFSIFGITMLSHRVAYELYNGSIPPGLMVCHKCDNPCCVNPQHLFLGTAQDNMDDKILKGRHVGAKKGESHHRARLTEWQVEEIRQRLKQSESQLSIAASMGVSKTLISNIKTGKRWAK